MTVTEFFKQQGCTRTTYLGDGVYAGQRHHGEVILVTEREGGRFHWLYLEEQAILNSPGS